MNRVRDAWTRWREAGSEKDKDTMSEADVMQHEAGGTEQDAEHTGQVDVEAGTEQHAHGADVHEALGSVETAEFPDHHVMEEIRRGYKLRDKLLRPALVRIAVNPAQRSE